MNAFDYGLLMLDEVKKIEGYSINAAHIDKKDVIEQFNAAILSVVARFTVLDDGTDGSVVAFSRGFDGHSCPEMKKFPSTDEAKKWLGGSEYSTICPACHSVIGVN